MRRKFLTGHNKTWNRKPKPVLSPMIQVSYYLDRRGPKEDRFLVCPGCPRSLGAKLHAREVKVLTSS